MDRHFDKLDERWRGTLPYADSNRYTCNFLWVIWLTVAVIGKVWYDTKVRQRYGQEHTENPVLSKSLQGCRIVCQQF